MNAWLIGMGLAAIGAGLGLVVGHTRGHTAGFIAGQAQGLEQMEDGTSLGVEAGPGPEEFVRLTVVPSRTRGGRV
jgi:hypothetical protein